MVEFANIIATLHNSESSQLLTPSSSSHSSTQIYTTMASFFHDLVFLFYEYDANNEGGQKTQPNLLKPLPLL